LDRRKKKGGKRAKTGEVKKRRGAKSKNTREGKRRKNPGDEKKAGPIHHIRGEGRRNREKMGVKGKIPVEGLAPGVRPRTITSWKKSTDTPKNRKTNARTKKKNNTYVNSTWPGYVGEEKRSDL